MGQRRSVQSSPRNDCFPDRSSYATTPNEKGMDDFVESRPSDLPFGPRLEEPFGPGSKPCEPLGGGRRPGPRRDVGAAQIPWCAAHGTGVIVLGAMQSGLLTDSFTAEPTAPLYS